MMSNDAKSERAATTVRDGDADTFMTPREVKDPLIGAQLGNYLVEARLGKGGFGSVYRAHDVKLVRAVAIKFLRDAVEPVHQQLFEREAKAIASLGKHPGIIQIYGWGEHHAQRYFVLEHCEASSTRLLDRHPGGTAPELALRIVVQAAEALEFAHKQGVIHRDIKPDNLLIDNGGERVKIADFGLASLVASKQHSILGDSISGSPPYMSPEQASGLPLDHRTDLYSLGVSLYYFLCGRLPVEADSVPEILKGVRRRNHVPLRDRRPGLPGALYALVDKATAREPEDRYQTGAEFAQAARALLDALEDREEGGPSVRPAAPVAGAAPSEPGPRMLTLMFIGLVDLAQLKARQGDHAAGAALARFRESVHCMAFEHSGRVINWSGEGCFLTFEHPSAAVQFALSLQDVQAEGHNAGRVRMGIHLGEVTETPGENGPPVIEGLAVDIASRLLRLAAPGQVLMSGAVYHSARPRIPSGPADAAPAWRGYGLRALEGISDPIEVYEAGFEGRAPFSAPGGGTASTFRTPRPRFLATAAGLLLTAAVAWLLINGLGGGPQISIAGADDFVNRGDYTAAAQLYTDLLENAPEAAPAALYGLGVVHLLQRDFESAEAEFGRIQDDALRSEGLIAVALARGAPPPAELSGGNPAGHTPYGQVLAAHAAISEGRYDEAVDLLTGAERNRFRYAWQHAEARRLLGVAYFRQGRYDDAARLLELAAAATNAQPADGSSVLRAYLEVARERMREEDERAQWDAVFGRLREVREMRREAGQPRPSPEARWTSGPLRFAVLRTDTSGASMGSGMLEDLAALLPLLLNEQLAGGARLQALERDTRNLALMVNEQALAAHGERPSEFELGQLLSAQLLIKPAIMRGLGAPMLHISVFNAETSEVLGSVREALEPDALRAMSFARLEALITQLAGQIHEAIEARRPLRGVLKQDGGELRINIGAAAGVRPGMRFAVAHAMDTYARIPGVSAVVLEVREDSARVSIEGAPPDAPVDGPLYVFLPPAEPDAAENRA